MNREIKIIEGRELAYTNRRQEQEQVQVQVQVQVQGRYCKKTSNYL
jgi:hypothetical protein